MSHPIARGLRVIMREMEEQCGDTHAGILRIECLRRAADMIEGREPCMIARLDAWQRERGSAPTLRP